MAITKKKITEALHRGVRAASENHRRWSVAPAVPVDALDRAALVQAPEYLIVVEIARKISSDLGNRECLRLEMPYREVLAGAEIVQGRGAPLKAIKDGKKADLALLKDGHKTTCVIEVKRNPSYQGIVRDLQRLRDVIYACRHKSGVLKHGFLSIYQSGDDAEGVVHATERVVDTIERFFKDDRQRARAKRPTTKKLRNDQAASIVVEITPCT